MLEEIMWIDKKSAPKKKPARVAKKKIIPKLYTKDEVESLLRDIYQLGKQVVRNPDYYSLCDPLQDFIKEKLK